MNHFREDEVSESRDMYIREIAKGFPVVPQSFPSSIQAQLYDDALRHLVRAISEKGKEDAPMGGTTTPSCGMERGEGQKRSCKDALKEIYRLLLCLQRQRLYDPPSDYEIGYYLLIKRYIRSILTFFVSGPEIGMVFGIGNNDDRFECYTPLHPIHHMEELSELNKHLADLSLFVSEADVINGSSIPLMGINENNIEVPSLITGSKDRSNAFYRDKFKLARLDLRSTEFAHCPPSEEEKRLYVQLIDHLALSSSIASIAVIDEVNVYSDMLCCLFIERIEQEVKDMDRHCMKIKDLILEKLSLTEKYEPILEQHKLEIKAYYSENDPEDEELYLMSFKRKLAQTCRISAKELPDYVKHVGRYQRIVVHVAVFIISRISGNIATFESILDILKTGRTTKEDEWRFLHSLTLIKDGRCLSGTVIQEHSISQSLKKRARAEFESGDECLQKCGNSQKEKEDNLNILRCIVEDLVYIGGLDIKTDKEEEQLLHNIWQNVASSIQCFVSALAYEQRHNIVKCGGVHHVRMPGLRTTPRKSRVTDVEDLQYKLLELADEMSYLSFILAVLRDGLHEERAGGNSD